MGRLPAACAVPLLAAAAAAAAQVPAAAVPGPRLEASAAVLQRRLLERGDDGRRLVSESGPLLRLQAAGSLRLAGGGVFRFTAAVAAGGLDYRGQTQGGVPLASDTAHRDLELGLLWRPWPAAGWGEAWLGLAALRQRRQIASTPFARGLHETSTLLLPGLRWSHAVQAAGWHWQPSVEWRASVRHRADIGFGGAFDAAHLKGGRRREVVLALDAAAAGSPWRWGLSWAQARQSASPVQPLSRGGTPVGTVRQPRLRIDEVGLRVGREF